MEQELQKLEKEKEMQKKRNREIATNKYFEEKEKINQKSYTSFGKLVLAKEKSSAVYSFGEADRFKQAGEMVTLPKETPGPIYNQTDKFKYVKPPQWAIGRSKRMPLRNGEKYEHYEHQYDEKFDLSKAPKKWNRTVGGAISLEPRIKYEFKEAIPGPGRYEYNYKVVKSKAPAYYFGEKSNVNSLKLFVGTNEIIGPGTYSVEKSKLTSKHQDPPQWSVGKAERPGLHEKTWTKNETYFLYSSVGNQIMSRKKTEPKVAVGNADRDSQRKLGMFKSMMSKQPTRIRLPHPKL